MPRAVRVGQVQRQVQGDDLPRHDADHRCCGTGSCRAEVRGGHEGRPHRRKADRGHPTAPRGEQGLIHEPSRRDHRLHPAGREVVDQHQIGAPPRCDHAAVPEAKGVGGRDRGRPIDRKRRRAARNRRADHEVEMALFRDVERVAVVGAEGEGGRGLDRDDLGQCIQVLADRAFPDQHGHALGQLLARLGRGRGFVVGADAGGQIAVEVEAAQQRRVPVDMAVLEQQQFLQARGIAMQHARDVHELGKADDLLVPDEGGEVGGVEPSARGLQMRRRHATRQLHAQVQRRVCGALQDVADGLGAEHVRDLMRIADHGRDAVHQHAAVEFVRRDERGFQVAMRIDEAGHRDQAACVDLARPAVLAVGADDAVAADRDVGLGERAGDEIEQPCALNDEVRRLGAAPLRDHRGEVACLHSPHPIQPPAGGAGHGVDQRSA